MHTCLTCGKEYKRLRNFQEHRALCEMLKKTGNESVNHLLDVPSLIDMWLAMTSLIKTNEKLEKKVRKLECWMKKEQKKLCLIDWLNENFKFKQSGIDMIKESELNQEDLYMIFEHDFIEGMVYIIHRLINQCSEQTIKAFDQKLNTLFIYSAGEWKILDKDEFKSIVKIVHRKLYLQLNNYNKINERRVCDSPNNEDWYKNISKVMGNNLNYESSVKKISFKLYNRIRYNLKHVIEYEFTF